MRRFVVDDDVSAFELPRFGVEVVEGSNVGSLMIKGSFFDLRYFFNKFSATTFGYDFHVEDDDDTVH